MHAKSFAEHAASQKELLAKKKECEDLAEALDAKTIQWEDMKSELELIQDELKK